MSRTLKWRHAPCNSAPRAVLAENIDSLLAHDQLDCLLIASPISVMWTSSRQLPPAFLANSCGKALIYRPGRLAQGLRLSSVIIAPVWVAMEYRYMPPMQQFLSRAESATGGIKMLTIVEHRYPFLQKVGNWNRFNRNSGGTLVEKCCHFFDLMRLALRSDPVRVMASAGQMVNHLDETYEGETPDIWDCGYVLVDFASGARAALELSMFADGSQFQEMIHAVGSEGKLEVKVPGPARLWTGPQDRRLWHS